jgi:hypothetical protein
MRFRPFELCLRHGGFLVSSMRRIAVAVGGRARRAPRSCLAGQAYFFWISSEMFCGTAS